jgi:2-dehydropantoate 2-reductase
MRIIVYGAGGIGGVVGGHLARSGQETVLIARGGHAAAISQRGLRLSTPTGVHTLKVLAVTAPEQIAFTNDDVVLLTMKGQDTEGAMGDLRRVVDDVPVFCLQNGVRNEETAARFFPRIYGAMVRIGAVYLSEGEVTAPRDPPGTLVIGRYPEGKDDLVEVVAASLRKAGFLVLTTPGVMPYKWGKLMGNVANAVGAITNARDEDVALITHGAQEELAGLLRVAGIGWVSGEQLDREIPEMNMPPKGSLSTEAQSSTWQSLARQTGTDETDYLNGEVVRLGQSLGLAAPINAKLAEICRDMSTRREKPGRYTSAELRSLVGLG